MKTVRNVRGLFINEIIWSELSLKQFQRHAPYTWSILTNSSKTEASWTCRLVEWLSSSQCAKNLFLGLDWMMKVQLFCPNRGSRSVDISSCHRHTWQWWPWAIITIKGGPVVYQEIKNKKTWCGGRYQAYRSPEARYSTRGACDLNVPTSNPWRKFCQDCCERENNFLSDQDMCSSSNVQLCECVVLPSVIDLIPSCGSLGREGRNTMSSSDHQHISAINAIIKMATLIVVLLAASMTRAQGNLTSFKPKA